MTSSCEQRHLEEMLMTSPMLEMPSNPEVQQAIEEILSRPEFKEPGSSFLQRIFWEFIEKLAQLFFKTTEVTGIPTAVIVVFFCVLLIAASVFLYKVLYNRKLKARGTALPNDDIERHVNPWKQAEDLANNCDFTGAFVWLFLAHLKDLEAHKLISLHKSKTTLHYEFELMQAGFAQIGEYRNLRSLYNAARYGNRRISKDDFDLWLQYCLRFIPGRNAA